MELINNISNVNWLSVIVVTLLSFALGSFWHSGIMFGKAWQEDNKIKIDKSKINPAKIFGLTALGHFVAMVLLDIFIGGHCTAIDGLIKGLLISVIWISSSIGATYVFAMKPLRLFLIDAGFYVVFYSLAGIILAMW